MSNYKRLGKNILSLTIGSFASKLLSFLFVPFYTAILSLEEYGIADLITTTVTLLFPFFTCIISESMLRFAQDKNEDKRDIYNVGMCVWGIGLLLLILFSPLLRFVPTLKNFTILVVIYYVFYSLNINVGYYVRGIDRVKEYAISGIINTFVVISSNLLFLLVLKAGVVGYVVSTILGNLVSAIYLIVSVKLYNIRIGIKKINKDLFNRMLKYSFPLIPNSASWWISNSSDRYILTYFAGAAANGVYSVAYKIPTIISMVTGIFSSAWRLSAVEDFGTEKSVKFYSNVFEIYITITLSMASAIMLINKPLSFILYQKEFYEAWRFVPVLLLSSVIHAYCDYVGTIYTSAMRTKTIFASTVAGAVTNVVLNIALIPKYAAMGAAIATLFSYIVVFFIRLIQSRKIMKMELNFWNNIFCFLLVFGQLIVASNTFNFEFLYSTISLLLIIFFKREFIKKTVVAIIQKKI